MATHVATRNAKGVIPKVLPPSSPFGELLRRSKFATFDPNIRQAYAAPPSYAQRGDYGLKRPIANRKTHGSIVLKNFEEHAQYIEWDNAKEQVRWIKMIEEMNISPQLQTSSTWASGLGPLGSSKESGLDSDFCPGEGPNVKRIRHELLMKLEGTPVSTNAATATVAATDGSASEHSKSPLSLSESAISAETLLPTRGKGAYGANAEFISPEEKGKMFLQPTLSAMPPPIFRRYIEKLRKMRPEFISFVRAELKKRWISNKTGNVNPDNLPDGELISQLGSSLLDQNFHLRFLGLRSEADYHAEPVPENLSDAQRSKLEQDALQSANKPQPIRPQPHRFAGLMYAQPTAIETYHTTKAQPGLYLEFSPTHHMNSENRMASFGGIVSRLSNPGVGAKPLFDSEFGANLDNLPQSSRMMRVVNLTLSATPNVVGRSARSNPLAEVEMRLNVEDDSGVDRNGRDNPYTPGSFEYNSLTPPTKRQAVGRASTPVPARAHAPRSMWSTTHPAVYDLSKYTRKGGREGAKDSQLASFRTLKDDGTQDVVASLRLGRYMTPLETKKRGKAERSTPESVEQQKEGPRN